MNNNGYYLGAEFQSLEQKQSRDGKPYLLMRISVFSKYDSQANNGQGRAIYNYISVFCKSQFMIDRLLTLGLPMGQQGNNQNNQQKIMLFVPYRDLNAEVYVKQQGNNAGQPGLSWSCSLDGDVAIISAISKAPQQNNQGGGQQGNYQQQGYGQQQGNYQQQGPAQGNYQQQFPQGQPQGWNQPQGQGGQPPAQGNYQQQPPQGQQQGWGNQGGMAQAPQGDPYAL